MRFLSDRREIERNVKIPPALIVTLSRKNLTMFFAELSLSLILLREMQIFAKSLSRLILRRS